MTLADEPPLRELPDQVIRQSLQHPENLRNFLQQAVPDLAGGFDCSRSRLLDREFPLEDWRHREADLPFEVPFRTADEDLWALVLILIEHQSSPDPWLPLRMLLFAAWYWERRWKEWERLPAPRPTPRLPPVLPLVLYTGDRPWNSPRTLADLLAEPPAFHAFAPTWQPLFWNLADQTPEALLASAGEWLQALAVIRAEDEPAEHFEQVFTEAVRHLAGLAGRDHVRWYDLMRIVLTWMWWRRPRAEHAQLEAATEASLPETALKQEIRTMNRKLGKTVPEIAMEEGQLLASREYLRMLLEERFGQLPEDLIRRIEATTDLDRLRNAIRQILRIQCLDELQM